MYFCILIVRWMQALICRLLRQFSVRLSICYMPWFGRTPRPGNVGYATRPSATVFVVISEHLHQVYDYRMAYIKFDYDHVARSLQTFVALCQTGPKRRRKKRILRSLCHPINASFHPLPGGRFS